MEYNKIDMLKCTALFSDIFYLLHTAKKVCKTTDEITNLIFPYLLPKQEEFFPKLNEFKREKGGCLKKADGEKGNWGINLKREKSYKLERKEKFNKY